MSTNLAETSSAGTSWDYLWGMESWTGAVFELLAHAAERAEGPTSRSRLMGARDDAEALRDLLHTANLRHDPNSRANTTIESICSLWDVNQARFEQLAAEVDPDFYEGWQARSEPARNGRHGVPLPYSA